MGVHPTPVISVHPQEVSIARPDSLFLCQQALGDEIINAAPNLTI
tara:strand:+ start:573 stop:707 length:135 start_codon:yes stop_codon:yes gene_type:complete